MGWLDVAFLVPFETRELFVVMIAMQNFLLRLLEDDRAVQLDLNDKPEFDHWQWVSYWYPLNQVISFKREVYRRAMMELAAPLGQFTSKLEGN